ncbi:MAG: gamma carbonic anhydrase family protein [Cyclobacteriaceae bacterium]|nr:gamma carbonic anhydrase family protein [Cyclobacteriaceae bacterium]MCB0500612.1 gamma carbonic anhydrase family protein [Cyclobacteriaceae bacterium]MCB9237433.1 gamma carbonic anhydrase family protein [Flammeovirgaceae bacterium]MCO5273102.1 gamma carbonic anhydrase family protein [Cyclobacteriaceae bacterium]MCW5903740.1 gamma carbonic anhydrase family protein [Cyclobacteriaceae bacterium]
MIIKHSGKCPKIDKTAYVAPNATICGDVLVGKNTRILFGAQIIAESSPIKIGDNCIILENAVIRGTKDLPVRIGNNCLIGPNTHLAGCAIENNVFLATSVSIFHGATVMKGAEIRVNGIVHLKTTFPENEILPIGWIAVGNPMKMFPPDKHEDIWEIQRKMDFPNLVYNISNRDDLFHLNERLCQTMSERLSEHRNDEIIQY